MSSSPFGSIPGLPAAWRLEVPTSTQDFPHETASVVAKDEQTSVDVPDLHDAGLNRGKYKHSTGWLISPDLFVTGGDVVYDAEYQLGPATQIKCYIGYQGQKSAENSGIQPRYGQKITTSSELISGLEKRSRDIAFIQVAKPFTTDVRIYNSLEAIPEPISIDEPVTLALPTVNEVDPVNKEDTASIETDTDGESFEVLKTEDNPPSTMETTVCHEPSNEVLKTENNPPPATETTVSPEPSNEVLKAEDNTPLVKETTVHPEPFYEVLSTVAKVDTKSLPITSPLLGPVGSLVSTAAGVLLSSVVWAEIIATGNVTEIPGASERALLAEASLQAVLAIKESPELDEILEGMEKNWTANNPQVDEAAALFCPQLTESAIEIATYRLESGIEQFEEGNAALKRRPLAVRDIPKTAVNGQGQDFIKGLFKPTLVLPGRREIFSSVGPVLKKAVSAETFLVSPSSKTTLAEKVPKLAQKGTISTAGSASNSNEEATRILLQRAIMADAALQALMSLPGQKLEALELDPFYLGKPEGIFDFLKSVVQKIGPVALIPAKRAAKQFAPILIDTPTKVELLSPVVDSGSKKTARKPSLRDMLNKKGSSTKVVVDESSALEEPVEAPPAKDDSALGWNIGGPVQPSATPLQMQGPARLILPVPEAPSVCFGPAVKDDDALYFAPNPPAASSNILSSSSGKNAVVIAIAIAIVSFSFSLQLLSPPSLSRCWLLHTLAP
ncbi:hypothetical protein G7046_g9680 [Stylonectria norvegica]|nr:hypothetical protein G7046_g9680 [Stylonectria norvegica]